MREVRIKTFVVSGPLLGELIEQHTLRGCLENGTHILRITAVQDYGDWVVETCEAVT